MDSDTLSLYLVPALVALLTAAGGLAGVSVRDADSFERRRILWLGMLVVATGLVTMAATNSATGVGRPVAAVGLTVSACAAAIGTHVLWRRVVPEAEPRTVRLSMTSIGLAVAVILASVSVTYVAGAGCRQAEPLMRTAWVESGYAQPGIPGQGPTAGEVADWAKRLREQADQVSSGGVAGRAHRLAALADEITVAAADRDFARQAVISAEYYDVLGALIKECHPQ